MNSHLNIPKIFKILSSYTKSYILCNRTLLQVGTNSNQLAKYNVNPTDSISFINMMISL